MSFRFLTVFVGLYLMGNAAAAPLDVVATNPSLGALVRAVAGERLEPTILAGPERDLHQLQAKPSMMRALRDADLVVAIGAELEIGWLPAAIAGAANPAIQPGRDGYFEAAAQVELLDVGGPADRALGDVHPVGNPHVDLDPVRMARIAAALAERLAQLDPAGAEIYRNGADVFAQAVEQRVADWRARLAGAPGVLLYHRDAIYLLDRFDVPLLGTIESTPGVQPSGQDLLELTTKLKGRVGVVIHTPYQSPQAPTKLARDLGWSVVRLPLAPPLEADGAGYLHHIERWVDAIAAARP
ncbi:zinc ABC transporter substrate-binding protein [Allochromatium humboldtianum]|uniref:Zinc ABC transporter substrate-binding protein n=1 Tax=Allochromatium humboldtianum TaxID=504901 RepID=A0A850RA17_9GAMM|nr:metal ABC transporter substrate-binding protein [Allochromatium humboldtianum]NVZ09186.1 zinc ABC transporter substrate-binding protein [Allochromatium humboldtianum]